MHYCTAVVGAKGKWLRCTFITWFYIALHSHYSKWGGVVVEGYVCMHWSPFWLLHGNRGHKGTEEMRLGGWKLVVYPLYYSPWYTCFPCVLWVQNGRAEWYDFIFMAQQELPSSPSHLEYTSGSYHYCGIIAQVFVPVVWEILILLGRKKTCLYTRRVSQPTFSPLTQRDSILWKIMVTLFVWPGHLMIFHRKIAANLDSNL